jgi:RimJ/RimL family protein N-acetyltransferase
LTKVDSGRDSDDLFAAIDHDVVWKHVAGRPSTSADLAHTVDQAVVVGRFPWLVRLIQSCAGLPAGTIVGTTSYLDVSVTDARLEIGFTAYDPRVWATRVNPETKLLLLAHAFDVLHAGRVQLKTDVRNVRSQQAIARLGAHYEGTLRRYQRRSDDTVRDTVMFSIIGEQWPAIRHKLHDRLGDAS